MPPSEDPPQLVYARSDIAIMLQPATGIVIVASVGLFGPEIRKARDKVASAACRRFFETFGTADFSETILKRLTCDVRRAWRGES